MDFGLLIKAMPLWLMFVVTLVATCLAIEAGTWLARVAVRGKPADPEAPLGALVAAILGLLGFLLAFTFGMAMSRFDARKQLLLDDANAIGTTYLRAGMLPASNRNEVRRLLRHYLELRTSAKIEDLPEILKKSDLAQDELWRQAESLAGADMDSELRSLFVASLNEMIDLHESRLTVMAVYRIPGMVWLSLYALLLLAMLSIGYQIGASGSSRLRGSPVLAAALSLVLVMIADIDAPGIGRFSVDQRPLEDVKAMMDRMESPGPSSADR